MNAREIIEKHGGKVEDSYSLISNWGYTFTHDGHKYDARRWANCYGSDCGWSVMKLEDTKTNNTEKFFMRKIGNDLNNIEINDEW